MKTNIHLSYLAHFFVEWEMFQTKVVGEIKTRISNYFFFKSCRLQDNVNNYSRARHITDDNTVHARCILDT